LKLKGRFRVTEAKKDSPYGGGGERGIREWNDQRLRWWLDASYPDRIVGRVDPETPMDRKSKREGTDPLKQKSIDRLDDESLSQSDRVLIRLFFVRLPLEMPPHYYMAAHENLLDPTLAGGYAQLEHLEARAGRRSGALSDLLKGYENARKEKDIDEARKAKEKLERAMNADLVVAEAAKITRAAYEWVLDRLEKMSFWLDVEPSERVKPRELVRDQHRQELARTEFERQRRKRKNVTQAIKATAEATGYGEWQLWKLTEDLRGRS
jgi:hypothetical protein